MGKTKMVTVNHVMDETSQTTWERIVTIPVPDNLTKDEEYDFIEDYLLNHNHETTCGENVTFFSPWMESNWNYTKEILHDGQET